MLHQSSIFLRSFKCQKLKDLAFVDLLLPLNWPDKHNASEDSREDTFEVQITLNVVEKGNLQSLGQDALGIPGLNKTLYQRTSQICIDKSLSELLTVFPPRET
ncbi:unnamed protein product [Larinioides sclopetarius]|uniref:Uncharacterized protein n=1 Tax=Larinioides sclopetarius TaxID=280406 RepID=A0AAV1Z0H3_9ARAC